MFVCTNLFYIFLFSIPSLQLKIADYSTPDQCKLDEYFNSRVFSCKICPFNLTSSSDGLKCTCNRNFKSLINKNDQLFLEERSCSSCQNAGACDCLENEIKVERNFTGTLLDPLKCLPCKENFYASADNRNCLPCSDIFQNANTSNKLLERVRKYCPSEFFTNSTDAKNIYQITFHQQVVDSFYLRSRLDLAANSCEENDEKECEHLSHLCILTQSFDSFPCQHLIESLNSPEKVFFLFNDSSNSLDSPISSAFSLFSNKKMSKLNFLGAIYSLEGEFKSISSLQLPCPFFTSIRFGVNIFKSCTTSVSSLIDQDIQFHVPFLSFEDSKSKKKVLQQLPVLVKNENSISNSSQLTRKFFNVDNVSGFKTFLSNFTIIKNSKMSVFRYIKSLVVRIKLCGQRAPGKIYPPVFEIEYGEVDEEDLEKNVKVSTKYELVFYLEEGPSIFIEVMIGVFIGLAHLHAVFKTWIYNKRNGNKCVNLSSLWWFMIHWIVTSGNYLFLISTIMSAYYFIVYKGQSVLHVLFTNSQMEIFVKILTAAAFSAKVIETIVFIFHYRSGSIFFIDWEQPKIVETPVKYDSPHTSLRKAYFDTFLVENESTVSQISSSKSTKSRRKKRLPSPSSSSSSSKRTSDESGGNQSLDSVENHSPTLDTDNKITNSEENTSVSIWRSYFVIKKWLEVKSERKTSVIFQAIFTIFFLEIIELKYWSVEVPELILIKDTDEFIKRNFLLKYAVGVIVYFIIYIVQWLFIFLYQKYIKNNLQEFVDLCAVSNVSIFILTKKYYGHYIHGRSVHGFADTDLLNLINNLQKEKNNLCAHRGLIPGTTDQTFTVYVSETFRNYFISQYDTHHSNAKRYSRRESVVWNDRWLTYLSIRKFLSSFIDHSLKNIDYSVKEKSLLEKLCTIECVNVPEESVFFFDTNNSFDEVMFHGNEWTLMTLELSTFLFALVIVDDFLLSTLMTIFLSKTVDYLAQFNQNVNLADKALIDSRFLR